MNESANNTVHASPSPSLNEIPSADVRADVTVRTLFQFLLGSREAILSLATRRDTFWLGLMLVISAGFAREHGRSDWLLKPWLIAVPLLATLAISLVLFPVLEVVARQRGSSGEKYWARFRIFVSLFWMTGPLAWIFALPTERLMSPDNAAIINLWFLGIVMLWRIALVARILSVLFVPRANEIVFTGTLFVVLLVADTLSICNFGGNRFVMMVGDSSNAPVAEFVIIHVMSAMAVLGVITWPLWLVGTLTVALREGTPWSWTVSTELSSRPASKGLRTIAAASVAVWVVLLPLAPLRPARSDSSEHPAEIRQSLQSTGDAAISR